MTARLPDVPRLDTQRLTLRRFEPADLMAWHRMLNDPEVSRFLPFQGEPVPMDRLEAGLGRGWQHWHDRGYGVWAVSELGSTDLIGHCGLRYLDEIHETEVLYALDRPYWGRGLATEAAGAVLAFGFDRTDLDHIVAFAVPENVASTRVMEKLGMQYEGEAHLFDLDLVRYAIDRASFAQLQDL